MTRQPSYDSGRSLPGKFLISRTRTHIVRVPFDLKLQIGALIEKRFDFRKDRFRIRENGGFAGFEMDAIDRYVTGLVDGAAQFGGGSGGSFLLHLLLLDGGQVIEGLLKLHVNVLRAVLRGQLVGRVGVDQFVAGFFERSLEVAKQLNVTEAFARSDVLVKILSFDSLFDGILIGVAGDGHGGGF